MNAGTIHLWSVELDRPGEEDAAFALLAEDERQRARRFHFPRDRRRFAIARAVLRVLLSRYSGRTGVAFVLGANGKPALAHGGPHFNLSHSGDLALIAVGADAPLGVDVEWLGRSLDQEALIQAYASPAERRAFDALPPDMRGQCFFHWWTRKEAVLKASGMGLVLPLDSFDVSIFPGDSRLLDSRVPELGGAWSLRDIFPADGHVGALASTGPVRAVETFRFGALPSEE